VVRVVEVELGKSTYSVSPDSNPNQVGGADRFVVVHEGRPVIVKRSSGQSFHVTYKTKRKARATATNLTRAGLACTVHEKP
jgi:hypothetical protein